MSLPVFASGETLVAQDRWHDLLWAAVPQHVICSTVEELITYVPTGAVATRASNRGLPGTETLTRDERKKRALRDRAARVIEAREAPDKLFFYRSGRWSRINPGWDHATGEFRGWYVNFELPAVAVPGGIATMDLVVDIWVNPDRTWEWKDRCDYQDLLRDGTLDAGIDARLQSEAALVIEEIAAHAGPFADDWLEFRPDPGWACPVLPAEFGWGGSAWELPTGPRLDQ